MTRPASPQSVIASIPGWETASYSPLLGGRTNRTFLLELDGKRAVLKIDDATRRAPFNSRVAEQMVQTAAADIGLAYPVLFADECIYLTEYVDGRTWGPGDLQDPSNLKQLAMLLKRVHAMPLTGRRFDAQGAAKHYLAAIHDADASVARTCEEIVNTMPSPDTRCCCHNDLVAANIVATPGLCLLDWEYACDNDPFFDLATIVAHHDLNDGHANILLNSYFDADSTRFRAKFDDYIRIYTALRWLWAASKPDHDRNHLASIANRLRDCRN